MLPYNIDTQRRTIRLPRPDLRAKRPLRPDFALPPPPTELQPSGAVKAAPAARSNSANPFVDMITSAMEQGPTGNTVAPPGPPPVANTSAAGLRTENPNWYPNAGTPTGPNGFALLSAGDLPDDGTAPPPVQEPPPAAEEPPPGTQPPPGAEQPPPASGGRRRAVTPGVPGAEQLYGLSLAEIESMGGNAEQYDTLLRWIDDGTERFGQAAMMPYVEQLRRAPGIISRYHADAAQAERAAGVKGMHFVDWFAAEGFESPLAGQMGPESAAAAERWRQVKEASSSGRWNGTNITDPMIFGSAVNAGQPPRLEYTDQYVARRKNAPPPANTAPPPATAPPPTTPTPAATTAPPPGTPPPAPGTQPEPQTFEQLMSQILKEQTTGYLDRMSPQFENQRQDVTDRMTQLGAITGAINSGGFGGVVSDALGEQYAREQATVAPQIADLTKNAQQLAMQKYMTDIDAAVKRMEITSTADIARAAQELQRYGIDQDTFMRKFEAEMQQRIARYGADASVQSAQLHAAASAAAASAAAEASMYNARLGYEADIFRGDIQREKNIMDYILGAMGLTEEWAKWLLGADPLGIITGQPPPGDVVVVP